MTSETQAVTELQGFRPQTGPWTGCLLSPLTDLYAAGAVGAAGVHLGAGSMRLALTAGQVGELLKGVSLGREKAQHQGLCPPNKVR